MSLSPSRQLTFDLRCRPALGRTDFFATDANALALAQVDDWQNWPSGRLALVGPKRSGKSHLAHVWAHDVGARICDLSVISSMDFSNVAPSAKIVVEDADGMRDAGPSPMQPEAEVALFHLCNRLAAGDGRLLLTAQTPPAQWNLTLPDLASRLGIAGVARLEPPDDRLLGAVIVKHLTDRQLDTHPEVVDFLLARIERSFAAAEAAVARLDREALARKRPVSMRLAADIFKEKTLC